MALKITTMHKIWLIIEIDSRTEFIMYGCSFSYFKFSSLFFTRVHPFWSRNLDPPSVFVPKPPYAVFGISKVFLSYNYQTTSTSSSHLCEINDATGKMCPQDMIKTTRYKYYEDKVFLYKKKIVINLLKALVAQHILLAFPKTCNACAQPVLLSRFRRDTQQYTYNITLYLLS